jgi:hypothetical protein
MVNTQFEITYDKNVLALDMTPGVNFVEEGEGDPDQKFLILRVGDGKGSVVNINPKSMPNGGIKGNASNNVLFTLILFIVLDLIFAIIAAQLWKRANRISPMSEKNKFLFYLWNELGVIMAIICFLPLIIFLLKDKKLDKKTKIIATVVAIVAMLVAGVASAEFNPISAEEKKSAENLITQDVCWTAGGHKYHIDDNCQSIRNSDYYKGTVKEAIESGKGTLCAFCAREVNEAAAAAMNPDTATPQQLEKLALLKELGYDETGIINIAQNLESLKTEGNVQSALKETEPEVNNLVQDETKAEEKR